MLQIMVIKIVSWKHVESNGGSYYASCRNGSFDVNNDDDDAHNGSNAEK